MTEITLIRIPLWYVPILVMLPAAVMAVVIPWLRRRAQKQVTPGKEPDWSIPPLAETDQGRKRSVIHRWDVRCKVVTILAYSFAVASLNHLSSALAAVVFSLVVLAAARVQVDRVVLRLLALTGFVGMLVVVMPLTVPDHPGDTLFLFGGMDWPTVNLRGLILAVTIGAKAVAIALLMEPMLSTAPLPVTLHGLSRLGVPDMAGQMILLSYRYLHVFSHEARRMTGGMKARGFSGQTGLETLRALSNFLGMLFVRSFERTERVFEAMQARGYTGRFPEPVRLQIQSRDIVLSCLWLLAGTLLVVYDYVR